MKQHHKGKSKKRTAKFSCLTLMKSSKESAMVSMTPVYHIYAGFCKETTLHGLKHTVAEDLHWFESTRAFVFNVIVKARLKTNAWCSYKKPPWLWQHGEDIALYASHSRFLWLNLIFCAFAGALYCALSQLSRYNSEPVVVSLQHDYRTWWTTFPAVTACFLDRVDPEKAKFAIETIWNVTEDDKERYDYYYGFISLVADISFRSNLQNFWKFQTDDTVKGVDLLQLALDVHPTYPLKVMVSQANKEVQWIPVMTEVGMCMSYNSEYAKFQFMLQDVEWRRGEELLGCHYHSGQCFVRIDTIDNAIRYFIHSPYDISTAISNPTGEVLPGEELIIDFKMVEIQAAPSVKDLRPEQRRCRYPDEWLSDNIQAYSFGLCQMHCRSRMAMMFCGCRPYFNVKGGIATSG